VTRPGPLILLVEDEAPMRRFLRATLRAHDYQVVEAATLREGLAQAAGRNPDLTLLDLGLPDGDGLDAVRQIRRSARTPIIVISARGQEHDKVTALDLGADDYLTKPFGVQELLARVRVALRHATMPESQAPVFESNGLRVDLEHRRVFREGQEVHLTPTEYKLLATLVRSSGKVLTHRQLLHEVWGVNYEGQTHYLRVYLAQLRQKLERDSARPRVLLTEPGVGYRLRSSD
jgi:two-component system, OmpR family, KDP operon response regulator KdpE